MALKKIHLAAAALLTLGVAPAGAAMPNLLDTLERGLWQLRAPGGGASTAGISRICLGNPKMLTQIRHGDSDCQQYVVKSTADTLTVSYSCKGEGQGITTIRKESGKIVHIHSQGIRNGSPFSFSVEGRLAGSC